MANFIANPDACLALTRGREYHGSAYPQPAPLRYICQWCWECVGIAASEGELPPHDLNAHTADCPVRTVHPCATSGCRRDTEPYQRHCREHRYDNPNYNPYRDPDYIYDPKCD